jgi:DNA-binding MarR family transcriptional regulator
MENPTILEEAKTLAALLPALMRQLFTLGDDLAVELPLAQLRVCAILRDGPCPMSTLSRELGVSLSAMTQIADRLERAKLVSRVTKHGDRRVRCLQLTQRCENIMNRHEESRVNNVLTVLNIISPNMRKDIVSALETLMKACVAAKTDQGSNGNRIAKGQHTQNQSITPKVFA